jgi:CRP-like cAMP-binding protein
MAGEKNLASVLPYSQFCSIDKEVKSVRAEDLQALPIFFRLCEAERKIIAPITQKKYFIKDEIIFNQGQPGGQLFVLSKGEVKVTRVIRERHNQTLAQLKSGDIFGEETLAQLKSGDIFGEETLICGDEHTTSVVCTADSEIFVIKKTDFDRIARENPVLATKILNTVTHSLCSELKKIKARICDMVNYVTSSSTDQEF